MYSIGQPASGTLRGFFALAARVRKPAFLAILPGIVLAGLIATLGVGLRKVPGFSILSPMILSILNRDRVS